MGDGDPVEPLRPVATYRLQLTADFGFDAARRLLPYLADLGIGAIYLSPSLLARSGSTHGYDAVDPSRVDTARGGEASFDALLSAAADLGLGVVLDIVPNHLAAAEENPWWWDLLLRGRASRYAGHFDIEWWGADPELDGKVLLPILGDELAAEIERGAIRVVAGDGVPRLLVYDRELPLAPESIAGGVGDDLPALLAAQHYVLAFWREGIDRLNWRRFFDVSELAGVRVEREVVFDDVHRRVLQWVADGRVNGLRIDHPDGLRDPTGYMVRLRERAPSAWIVAEKILATGERLPADWPIDGTTGYDFLAAATGLFVDPAAEASLTATCARVTGACPPFAELARDKRWLAVRELFPAETARVTSLLADALGEPPGPAHRAAIETLLVSMPVYRTYVPESGTADARDRRWLRLAFDEAGTAGRADGAMLERLHRLLTGDEPGGPAGRELRARFQQLSGPVMAKGFEDTALYCDRRLLCLNEVGGDPRRFGTRRGEFHDLCAALQRDWPDTMVALSTHDTKRSADVRLRIATLSEIPDAWAEEVVAWQRFAARHRAELEPPLLRAGYHLFQTMVGCWPAAPERIVGHLTKSAREAKQRTSWLDPDHEYEEALVTFAEALLADPDFVRRVEAFVARILPAARVHGLAAALLHLTAVGVPDLYEGTEAWRESLTDPDNRRPVDFPALRAGLAAVAGRSVDAVRDLDVAARKQWLTHRTLAVRRERPASFGSGAPHARLPVGGADERHAVAFRRGDDLAVVVPRFLVRAAGRVLDFTVELPPGTWRSAWDGRPVPRSATARELFATFPVALLVRGA